MALSEFVQQLDELAQQAETAFSSASDPQQLEEVRVDFLGAKSGRFKKTQKLMGSVEPQDRPAAGKRLNEAKQRIETAFQLAKERLSTADIDTAQRSSFDPSLPGVALRTGRLHPITQTIDELKDIMGRLGFTAADGPEIEDEWHNFEALNIPRRTPGPRSRWTTFTWHTARQQQRRRVAAAPQPDQHRADPRDGKDAAARAHHFAGTRLPTRYRRRHPLPDVPPDGRAC